MSRAFIREDVDPPERSGRVRSASGLPPGTTNYITARGARRLREQLAAERASGKNPERVAELEQILASVTIVEPPEPGTNDIVFGATVTVQAPNGELKSFTIVGVDELTLEPDAASWVSPMGKALLASEMGGRVMVGEQNLGRVVKVEHRR
ncbi:MAG TPA: GreA/GreB family elongation factor [Chthoniobacterales bacterium]|nr:GreA/GreB family elongation factor [Chthoniobacterales bacterium]